MMVLVFRWNGFEEDEEAEQKRIVDHKQKMLLSVKDDVEIAASEERELNGSRRIMLSSTNTRKDNERYFVTLKVASTI